MVEVVGELTELDVVEDCEVMELLYVDVVD